MTLPAIVLVQPQIPENIGAVCRTMANFGFSELILVNPCDYLNSACQALALFSYSIAEQAKVYDSLEDALASFALSFGFTRRTGRMRRQDGYFHHVLRQLQERQQDWVARTALVFGGETSGLSKADTYRCSFLAELPTSSEYGSMNLSQAVTCACYEYTRTLSENQDVDILPEEELQSLLQARQQAFDSLHRLLDELDFFSVEPRDYMHRRIQNWLERSLLSELELRSIHKFTEKMRRKYQSPSE